MQKAKTVMQIIAKVVVLLLLMGCAGSNFNPDTTSELADIGQEGAIKHCQNNVGNEAYGRCMLKVDEIFQELRPKNRLDAR